MTRYLFRRLLGVIVVLAGASMLIFFLVRLSPGDPVDIMFGPSQVGESQVGISEEAKEIIREELGLHRPYSIQYYLWVKRMVHLDFGHSFRTRQPVVEELLARLPATACLAVLAFGIEILVGVPLGIVSALFAGNLPDRFIRTGTVFLRAIPSFWLALLLLSFFAVQLQWVAVSGDPSFQQIILPALVLGLLAAPRVIRLLRASILAELNKLYLVSGRAKGVRECHLIFHHVLPNGMLPVVTLLGMSLSDLLCGAVIVETVFSWPGIGMYVIESINNRDYPVIQVYVLFTTVIVVGMNLLVDLLYTFLDPRVRHDTL